MQNGVSALEAATSTVSLFEDDPLFNCGHGAVFNRAGGIELEASVMVSSGYKKSCAAVSLLRHVKNPILLARNILEHGEQDLEEASAGAQGHVHISGPTAEDLAKAYGLELKPQSYFWTRKRWEEHKRGLQSKLANEKVPSCEEFRGLEGLDDQEPPWDGFEYLPQGTVGCVAADVHGVICTATSTGGLTNKLPGRIGDTPTVGAGFWAEEGILLNIDEFDSVDSAMFPATESVYGTLAPIVAFLPSVLTDCLPFSTTTKGYQHLTALTEKPTVPATHALALSGTGNGDSFLRVSACRTAGALALPPQALMSMLPKMSLSDKTAVSGITLRAALKAVAGPGGLLQQSAGDRWNRTGEGEGGIIGIERRGKDTDVVFDMNSSGMFRAYIDSSGRTMVGIFRGDDEVVHNP